MTALDAFRERGIDQAGELLFEPADALFVLEELERGGQRVLGLDVWYPCQGRFAEEPGGLDLSELGAADAAAAAREFLTRGLPPPASRVSFVVTSTR